ncbi:MAG: prepilin-type N-terminal cleavage/methylation domain-containing protein [Oceanospirillaceae bacterium]|nr:prepilin-type N-terminal cleavage/methylation domain-containing protein [Oceanospirillaceae bacterium]
MGNSQRAFSLMELLLVLALVGIILGLAMPTWRQHQLSVGRQQAWLQLQRIGLQQEIWHLQHGRYFEDINLASIETHHGQGQERYHYQVTLLDAGFLLSATVNHDGLQKLDALCWSLTLSDVGEMKSLGKAGQIHHCR